MEGGRGITRFGPLRLRTVRGEPYLIGERTLVPVVHIVSFGKARATVGTRYVGGWGSGFAWIKPLAVVEITPQGERRIPVEDAAARARRDLLVTSLAILCFLTGVRLLLRRRRRARHTE